MKTIVSLFLALNVLTSAQTTDSTPVVQDVKNLSVRNEVGIAIDRGLEWLKKQQNPDGSWSTPDYPALTALVLTAFKREPSGAYTQPVDFISKGYSFLLSNVQPDGGIYKKGLSNYNTSISLTALLHAKNPEFADAIERARAFVVGQQAKGMANPSLDGGIGYGPGGTNRQHPDMSNTLMALEALYYEKVARGSQETAPTKDLDWQAAIGFIQRSQNLSSHNKESWVSDDPANKGGFVYFPGHSMAGEMSLPDGRKALRSYGSMSYAGLLSYIYAGLEKDDPRVTAVLDWLRTNYSLEENPGMGDDGRFYFYHTMAKALATYGATELELADGKKVDWRKELALKLIQLQDKDGSWVNTSGRWMEKDPVLVTTYAVLALEFIFSAM